MIHLPFAGDAPGERVPGGVPSLVSETRRLVEECVEKPAIERFVYLSSVFVYDPEPGNGNVVSEGQLLGFDGEGDARVRAWIDADLVCQGELHGSALRMTILRAATIVTEAGEFLNSPPLARRDLAVGYDPMLAVVSDRDVARALVLALHADRPGIYNIAGHEVFPRSQLCASERRLAGIRAAVAARRGARVRRAAVRRAARRRGSPSTATGSCRRRGSRTRRSASSRSTGSRCAATAASGGSTRSGVARRRQALRASIALRISV